MQANTLIITGMHRSGTSLIAEYLSECGLFVGNNLINLESQSNASAFNGHHEDEEFLDFHLSVLRRLRIQTFPTWEFRIPPKLTQKEAAAAKEMVDRRADLPMWGWKDPRTTLFLQEWLNIIPKAYFLLLFRDPFSVVDSLIRRGTDKKIKKNNLIGLKSWKIYNQQVLNFYSSNQNSVLLYDIDQIIAQPVDFYDHLKAKFNLDLTYAPFESVFSQNSLKGNCSELREHLESKNPILSRSCENIYQKLSISSKLSQNIT